MAGPCVSVAAIYGCPDVSVTSASGFPSSILLALIVSVPSRLVPFSDSTSYVRPCHRNRHRSVTTFVNLIVTTIS